MLNESTTYNPCDFINNLISRRLSLSQIFSNNGDDDDDDDDDRIIGTFVGKKDGHILLSFYLTPPIASLIPLEFVRK